MGGAEKHRRGEQTPGDRRCIRRSSLLESPYLKRLEELHLVRRRIPATIPPERRQTTKTSRYHLIDPYLRFYFRFIAPNAELVEQERGQLLWERI